MHSRSATVCATVSKTRPRLNCSPLTGHPANRRPRRRARRWAGECYRGMMTGMDHDEPVPEADAIERERAGEERSDDLRGAEEGRPGGAANEQAETVADDAVAPA